MRFPWGKTFLIGFGFFGISLIWPLFNSYVQPLLEGFGLSAFWIGFVMTLDNYANLFLQPAIGNLSDRTRTTIGRRKPFMLIGAPLAAVAFMLIPHMPALSLLIAAILVTNLAMAVFRSPTVALLGDLFVPAQRSRANGVINLMGGLAGAIALFGGAALYEVNNSAGLPFFVMALLMLAAVGLVVLVVREPEHAYRRAGAPAAPGGARGGAPPEREVGLGEALRAVFRQRDHSLALIFLAILCWSIGFSSIEAFFTLFGEKVLEIPVSQASRMLTFFAAAGVVFAIPAGLLGTYLGRRRTVLICLAILTVLFGSAYFVSNVSYVQIMLIIAGAAWTSIIVNALPMVLDAAPTDNPGSYTGQYYIFGSLAAVIGPPLAGALIELTGNNYRTVFLFGPVFMFLALLLMLPVRRGEPAPAPAGPPADQVATGAPGPVVS
jgi:MFS family permease